MGSIFSIISSAFWLVCRWLRIKDDPANKYQKAKDENAEIIKTGNAGDLNSKLDNLTDRL